MATSLRFLLICSLCLGCALARFFRGGSASPFTRSSLSPKSVSKRHPRFTHHGFTPFHKGPGAHFFQTVPGGPCAHHHKCTTEKSTCGTYFGRNTCLTQRHIGDSCNEWFETCVDSVCRGGTCTTEDNKADKGEVCTDSRPCLDGHECRACDWIPGEKRCVKVVDDFTVCDNWFEGCASTAVCQVPEAGGSPVCVPYCIQSTSCPVPGCIMTDRDCPCNLGDAKSCVDFTTFEYAKICLEKCGSDVHDLVKTDNGLPCDKKASCIPPTPAPGATDCPIPSSNDCPTFGCNVANSVCPCDQSHTAKCSDFGSKEMAAACFGKCPGDPHGLDKNMNGLVCKNKPPCGTE